MGLLQVSLYPVGLRGLNGDQGGSNGVVKGNGKLMKKGLKVDTRVLVSGCLQHCGPIRHHAMTRDRRDCRGMRGLIASVASSPGICVDTSLQSVSKIEIS